MNMDYPQFLDIEASMPDEGQYPVEISWTLRDGTIKSVIISPDDEWDPWDMAAPDLDVQHLMDQGVSPGDIIRELNEDLGGQTVYVDGLDDDERLLELLFDACGAEPDFELATLKELSTSINFEDLLQQRREIAEQNSLDLEHCEDQVRCLLFLSQQL